jgi:hypothetical protein
MLRVRCPAGWEPERAYAIAVVLGDRLGLEYEIVNGDGAEYVISAADGRTLRMPDRFFPRSDSGWTKPASLPGAHLATLDASAWGLEPRLDAKLPILYGATVDAEPALGEGGGDGVLPVDVFGSAFFMLTRYEELVLEDRDEHDRFPAHASVGLTRRLLERPIVDEYVEVLRAVLRRLWPGLQDRRRAFNVVFSFDIDRPFRFTSAPQVARGAVSRLLGGDVTGSLRWVSDSARRVLHAERDPFYRGIHEVARVLEEHGARGVFNFMAAPPGPHDAGYDPASPLIRGAMEGLQRSGHEIGFHPGYRTHADGAEFDRQLQRLRASAGDGIRGGRQHYLRFSVPETWIRWDAAGLEYDSTVGWSEVCGFRAGTCTPYRVYDLAGRRALNLVERPLIVMDSALRTPGGAYLTPGAAVEKIRLLADRCAAVGGEFVFLWHNSSLWGEWEPRASVYHHAVRHLTGS